MIAVRRIAATATLAALTALAAPMAAPSALAATPGPGDASFLKAIHQVNLEEIESGTNAGRDAKAACTKKVGAILVRDHTKLDIGVKELAAKLGVTLPTAPSPAQRKAIAAVQAKAGTSGYDAAWLKNEDMGHVETLKLIDREVSTGRNSQVRAAAQAARPVVARHLELIRACERKIS
ncbi:DUF4142 domain-containing protein [Streptomyces sp. NRRL F-5135]|uniref:DUF4142 domain-containing protein n=1 Tax=Streptomyces sp. NRRL F-5135 TaxID=1463858 RepID=UPI0006899263|nr:DUF4142 domain-containing protein [Streptomyces sp. NRRL F-5135]